MNPHAGRHVDGPALASISRMAQVFGELVGVCLDACRQYEQRDLFGTRLASGVFRWTTYGEFQTMVDRARAGLSALGVGPGDRVAIVSGNSVEWAAVCQATYGLEAALVPLPDRAAEREDELRFVLTDATPKVAVASTNGVYAAVSRVARGLQSTTQVIGIELPEGEERSYARMLRRGDAVPVLPHRPTPEAVAMLVYTSGDEDRPKVAAFTHGNLAFSLDALCEVLPISADDRSLSLLSWAHPFGHACELHHFMRAGASCALCEDAGNVLVDLKDVAPTVLVGLPRTFKGLYGALLERMGAQSELVRKLFEDAIRERLRARSAQPEGTVVKSAALVDDALFFSRLRARLGGRLRLVVSASTALEPEVAELLEGLQVPVVEWAGPEPSSELAARATAAGPSKEHRQDVPDESKSVP